MMIAIKQPFEGDALQCFDTIGRVTVRASGLYKVGFWFVGGDDLTGAVHVL